MNLFWVYPLLWQSICTRLYKWVLKTTYRILRALNWHRLYITTAHDSVPAFVHWALFWDLQPSWHTCACVHRHVYFFPCNSHIVSTCKYRPHFIFLFCCRWTFMLSHRFHIYSALQVAPRTCFPAQVCDVLQIYPEGGRCITQQVPV